MQVANTAIQIWASWYADHAWLRSAVVYAHIGGLLIGGGAAISADRWTLQAYSQGESERAWQLGRVARTHKLVIGALGVIILSGFLQFFSDTGTFLHSWIFWTKMGFVVALLANGAWLTLVESQAAARAPNAEPEWRRLRLISWLSLFLWLTITFWGAALISH